MNNMTDLWTEAIRDPYAERYEAALDAASSALATQFAFVTEATSKASYEDRLSLVASRVEGVVGAATQRDEALFAPVHEAILSQWEMDFDAITAARQSESQRTGNKRAWWRKKERAEAGTKTAAEVPVGRSDYNPRRGPIDGRPPLQRNPELYSTEDILAEIKMLRRTNDKYGEHALRTSMIMKLNAFLIENRGVRGYASKTHTSKLAMTAAESQNLVAAFPEAVRPRVAAMADLCVYGPDYSRGVTDNLFDALHFAKFETGGDDMEYFLRRAEAQAVLARGGEWEQPMHPRSTPEQQKLLGSIKTAGSYDDGYRDGYDDSQSGQGKTFGISTDQQILDSYGLGPDYLRGYKDGWARGGGLTSMLKGAPFAGYKDFDACVAANSDKDDPSAYCGKIMHQVEDGKKSSKTAGAYEDGRAAFNDGQGRVAPYKPSEGAAVGTDAEWTAKMQDWYRGWDAANLADDTWVTGGFEASLSKIKTTNDPMVLQKMIVRNALYRQNRQLDVTVEASLNAQDEVAKVRLEQLGVSASANNDLVDWSEYMDRLEKDRKKVNTDGSPAVDGEKEELIDWAGWTRAHGVLTRSFGNAAVTVVREGALVHWAVTDEKGTDEKASGSEPTVRDALEQAWDVLNKVLDKEPPPSGDIVQEVKDAADATSDAVEDAGGTAPEDAAATDGKPVADPDKDPVHPADPQPGKEADPKLEAKPDAPVDDTKTDPSDVKVDPDVKDANPDVKVDPDDPKKTTDPDAPPADPDAKGDVPPQLAKDKAADPASGDGATSPSPDAVVDQAEDQSMGDVLGLDPTTMDVGQRATMTYTLSDGTTGDTDVTFLREDNGIYFFDGPNGEFGLGDREDEWVDADGNSFAFSSGDAVEEVTGDDDADNGATLEDIDLDVPVKKDDAPTDGDKAPAKDDSKDDGDKDKKSKPPWLKSKKSMLAENPWMSDEMATRLAQRAAKLATTLTTTAAPIILPMRLLSEPCAACGAAPGQPCRTKIGDSFVPVDWTHTR